MDVNSSPGIPDSYDALAASIERALRSDLAPPGSAEHLAGSIDRIMLDESRAGELRVGWLRLIVVAAYLVVTTSALLRRSVTEPTLNLVAAAGLSTLWLLIAALLVVALRRGWYARWVPHLSPFVDAVMILAGSAPAWLAGGAGELSRAETLAQITALCAFLSLSGALRLSRFSARTGTALAVVVFLLEAALARLEVLPALAIGLTLLSTGLLGASVTGLVRRVVTDEVARATLKRMYEDAEDTIDAREQVLKIVSHDLRNPLHTISMCAALLLDLPLPPEQQASHLQRIKRAGERMNRLIQDLMDVAKLEAGRVGIDARRMEVAPIVREAHEMLAPLATEKNIRLDGVCAESLPTIMADAGRVLQVLSNLVGNALKFTPANGRVVIRADAAPGGVRFSVSDTGQGIPPEQLAKIFGRFWQANPADRRGIGLGLTIAKGIVEAHGGRIWVESRVGEGTTFHFTLGVTLPSMGSGSRERRSDAVVQRTSG
jgi:signal transduction histidine kinase